jgi:hypothetical protein
VSRQLKRVAIQVAEKSLSYKVDLLDSSGKVMGCRERIHVGYEALIEGWEGNMI